MGCLSICLDHLQFISSDIFSVFSVLVLHFFLTFISMDFIILCSCGCNYCWNWIFYISHILQSCLTHLSIAIVLWWIWQNFIYKIILSTNKDSLNLPFQFGCFISRSCVISLSRIYHTLLNRSDEGEIYVLFCS